MPTLRNLNGASLVPDVSGGMSVLLKAFGTPETRAAADAERQRQQGIQEALAMLLGGGEAAGACDDAPRIEERFGAAPMPETASQAPSQPAGGAVAPRRPAGFSRRQTAALARLATLDPKVAQEVRATLEYGNEQQVAAMRAETERGTRLASHIARQPTFQAKRAALNEAAAAAAKRGEPLDRYLELMNMPEQQLDLAIQRMQVMGTDLKTLTTPQERFEAVTDEQGRIIGQRSSTTGKMVADPRAVPTDDQREFELDKARAGATRVNVGGTRVQAFEKESGKLGAQADNAVRTEVRGNARAAGRHKARVKSLERTLMKAAQGPLAQFIPSLSRVIPGLDGTNEQVAAAQINDFVLDKMAAFKGSTSEKELDFARETVAKLGNTREANMAIIRSFLNASYLAEVENEQFDRHTANGGKARDFVFDFDTVILPGHPTHGDVTVSDIQETAMANGLTMEAVVRRLKAEGRSQ